MSLLLLILAFIGKFIHQFQLSIHEFYFKKSELQTVCYTKMPATLTQKRKNFA